MLVGLEQRLESVVHENTKTRATVSLLLGAVFCLKEAVRKDTSSSDALDQWIQSIANSKLPVQGNWRQNFYLNSSLQRLAAVLERGLKLLTKNENRSDINAAALWAIAARQKLAYRRDYAELEAVRREVNRLKHDVLGLSRLRQISLTQAEKALEQAVRLIEKLASIK